MTRITVTAKRQKGPLDAAVIGYFAVMARPPLSRGEAAEKLLLALADERRSEFKDLFEDRTTVSIMRLESRHSSRRRFFYYSAQMRSEPTMFVQ